MNNYGLTTENMLRVLPDVLRNDDNMRALATAIADSLAARTGEITDLQIYTRIDTLPEELLDILAYDFKVDWWSADYSVEEKRQTLKDSWAVHKTLGTKGAVEKALSAIFPQTRVKEWYEYDGNPYMFKVIIGATDAGVSVKKQAAVLERIGFYKNQRSHLEAVSYRIEKNATVQVAAIHSIGRRLEVYPYFARDIETSGNMFCGGVTQFAQTIEIYPNS